MKKLLTNHGNSIREAINVVFGGRIDIPTSGYVEIPLNDLIKEYSGKEFPKEEFSLSEVSPDESKGNLNGIVAEDFCRSFKAIPPSKKTTTHNAVANYTKAVSTLLRE